MKSIDMQYLIMIFAHGFLAKMFILRQQGLPTNQLMASFSPNQTNLNAFLLHFKQIISFQPGASEDVH